MLRNPLNRWNERTRVRILTTVMIVCLVLFCLPLAGIAYSDWMVFPLFLLLGLLLSLAVLGLCLQYVACMFSHCLLRHVGTNVEAIVEAYEQSVVRIEEEEVTRYSMQVTYLVDDHTRVRKKFHGEHRVAFTLVRVGDRIQVVVWPRFPGWSLLKADVALVYGRTIDILMAIYVVISLPMVWLWMMFTFELIPDVLDFNGLDTAGVTKMCLRAFLLLLLPLALCGWIYFFTSANVVQIEKIEPKIANENSAAELQQRHAKDSNQS
jgi:Protein of unknown function (DUF3592)